MRPWTAVALLTSSAGTGCNHASTVFAEDEQAGKRKVVTKVVPTYPELARKLDLHGVVKLEVVIAPNGSLKSGRVGGNPLLSKAAQDAVEKWRWAPAPQESKESV